MAVHVYEAVHDPKEILCRITSTIHFNFRGRYRADGSFYSLPQLEREGIERLPLLVCIRIVLESILRNFDGKGSGKKMSESSPIGVNISRTGEIPFVVLHCFAGLYGSSFRLIWLPCGRLSRASKNVKMIEPLFLPIWSHHQSK